MTDFYSFSFGAMGTECLLHLYTPTQAMADDVSGAAIAEVLRIEQRYSRFKPDSVLMAINGVAQAGGQVTVDEETAGLLDYAFACYQKSAGLFDISAGVLYQAWNFEGDTLPSQDRIQALMPWVGLDKIEWRRPVLRFAMRGMCLDFGGIGKEYAADRVADVCLSCGVHHGLVDLGGDIRIIGPHPDGQPWRVGLRDPAQPDVAMRVVDASSGAIASSGDYERCITVDGQRYGHILDPFSGWPARGVSSVSVWADRCMVAGSVATIAMLKGRNAAAWLQSLGLPHVWVDETGQQGGNLLASAR